MHNRFDASKKQKLLAEERYELLQPDQLLRRLGVAEGQTVADIGCGPGFFTVPAAQIVGPTGQVLAGDVQGEMLTAVRGRVAEAGLTNVHVVKTSATDVPIPPGKCDFVLLAFVLHEVEQRASFVHRLGRLLKPGARLAVLEWEKREEDSGPPVAIRIDKEELAADATAAGLRVVECENINERQYYCLMERAG